MSKSKVVINISEVNVCVGNHGGSESSNVNPLIGALLACAMHEKRSEATCADGSLDTGDTPESAQLRESPAVNTPSTHHVLNNAFVMRVVRTENSSTGFELDESRKQGAAISVSDVHGDDYVAVQAASAEGNALRAVGGVESTGFVNKYYSTGNFGRTIHATMDKAEQYAEGDCVAVEVYIAYAKTFTA